MPDLKTEALRIASELPVGHPTRRKLLEALDKTARLDGSAFQRGSYFHTFFNEKGLPSKMFTVTDKRGVVHSIPGEVVLEHLAMTRGSEKSQAEAILRKIDFANGDVNHFLEHLAKGIAMQYEGVIQ